MCRRTGADLPHLTHQLQYQILNFQRLSRARHVPAVPMINQPNLGRNARLLVGNCSLGPGNFGMAALKLVWTLKHCHFLSN